jgi:Neutral/alkaline non-lysosomal ceramidase, N-terminal
MKIGRSEKIITPSMATDLSGYVGRVQPSTGKYDELYARVIFMESDETKIVWINCDLLGFSNSHATRIRQLVASNLSINIDNIVLGAIHTHAGPATVKLRKCGDVHSDYINYLETKIVEAACEAAAKLNTVDLYFTETSLDTISQDRRMQASCHIDNKLPIMAFSRGGNVYDAILINFALHSVGLAPGNRHISADIAGYTANWVKSHLPGHPTVLVTNGACGNIDPVERSADYAAVEKQGKLLGEKIIAGLINSTKINDEHLEVSFNKIELPLDELSKEEITEMLEDHHKYFPTEPGSYGSRCVQEAMEEWAQDTINLLDSGEYPKSVVSFFQIINIGPVTYVGINAEVFSIMADMLREKTGKSKLYVVGYANGCIGYLPQKEIYQEGGYEVDSAYKFYGNFRIKPGGFEKLRDAIIKQY